MNYYREASNDEEEDSGIKSMRVARYLFELLMFVSLIGP